MTKKCTLQKLQMVQGKDSLDIPESKPKMEFLLMNLKSLL